MDINEDIFKGKLKEISGKIKQYSGEITDDEIAKMKGSREELLGILQKKYGYDKERSIHRYGELVRFGYLLFRQIWNKSGRSPLPLNGYEVNAHICLMQ